MDAPPVTRFRSRRQTVIAGAAIVAALLLVGLSWFGSNRLLTPRTPDVAQVGAADVAAYLADPRGLQGLSGPPRQAFLDAVVQHYQSKEQRQQLAAALENLSPSERDVVRDAIFETMKAQVLEDARRFRRMQDAAARDQTLEENVDKYDTPPPLAGWRQGDAEPHGQHEHRPGRSAGLDAVHPVAHNASRTRPG